MIRNAARWVLPEPPSHPLDALAQAAGAGPVAARILWNRGLRDAQAMSRFLHPSLADLLDPFAMAGMPEAVARLRQAIEKREKILLYGDYDVDGTVSIVLLTKAITLAGGVCAHHVPHRLREGYGMRAEVIEAAARDGVGLVVSVDTGIRAAAVVQRARELGLDVIVTDHHLPEQELPPALAVLNPNRPGCPYPNKNLCGAGVTFKLVQALFSALDWPAAKTARLTESFLKIVALATVADVVPLAGENRAIVSLGLDGFDQVRNPGLRELLAVAGFQPGEKPTSTHVAFRLAPRINAAGRMDDADAVIRLLLTSDVEEAKRIAGQLQELNQDRQQAEADIVRQILEECERTPVTDDEPALVFAGDNWHRGVVGIVASRLVERYHRPVFVLSNENGVARGSGRSAAGFHLLEALETMPELFTAFGGHRQAAGVTLDALQVAQFRDRFQRQAGRFLTPNDFRPTYLVDAEVSIGELNDQTAVELSALAPFGCENPAPLLMATGVETVGQAVPFGETHLRFRVRQQGAQVTMKAFRWLERAAEVQPGQRLDLLFSVEEDRYSASRGYSPWALHLRDARPAANPGESGGNCGQIQKIEMPA